MILICDDDGAIRSSLEILLKRAGYTTSSVATPKEAIEAVKREVPKLVLMDMNYTPGTSGEEGLTLLSQIKIFRPQVPVILITAWGSISLAVRGMKAGAFDFITKPWNNLSLLATVDTALKLSGSKLPDMLTDGKSCRELFAGRIIGSSPLLLDIFETIDRVAGTDAPVLIAGESGTGKELVAEALHICSRRHEGPLVKVNLGGVPSTLFESEMFGHRKGAFTDAHYDRKGRFEMADGGTIFLDEAGELELSSQVKLLRVLQDRSFEPLGESRTKQVDVRVITATNRDLPSMVAAGTFREDLYYRMNLITIRVPSLRERPGDIPALVRHFVKNMDNGREMPEVTPDAMEYLKKQRWPGNIRELRNLVERTVLVSGKETLGAEDFRRQYASVSGVGVTSGPAAGSQLEDMERAAIETALLTHGNNLSRAAASLGLSRQALYRRMEKYGMDKK